MSNFSPTTFGTGSYSSNGLWYPNRRTRTTASSWASGSTYRVVAESQTIAPPASGTSSAAVLNIGKLAAENPAAIRRLNAAIREMQLSTRVLDDQLQARDELIAAVSNQVAHVLPGSQVKTFGSIANGSDTCTSDIDLTVMSNSAASDNKALLRAVLTHFRTPSNAEKIGLISISEIDSRIHILKMKCETPAGVFDIDMSMNNVRGVANSALLRVDWRASSLVAVVKHWFRANGMLGSDKRHLNSYSLQLLVINYLQKGLDNAIVPVFHEDYPEFFPHGDLTTFLAGEKAEFPKPQHGMKRSILTPFELFVGFVNFYATFQFDKEVIDIKQRQTTVRKRCAYGQQKPVEIVDPVGGMNPARCLSPENFESLQTALRTLNEVFWGPGRNGYTARERRPPRPMAAQQELIDGVFRAVKLTNNNC